jgi:hypothetical protein
MSDERVIGTLWEGETGILTEDDKGRVWFYAMTTEQMLDMQAKLHEVEMNHLRSSGVVEVIDIKLNLTSPYDDL